MIKTVIFDVDGTLVDTVDMHAEAWQRALKEYGKVAIYKDPADLLARYEESPIVKDVKEAAGK